MDEAWLSDVMRIPLLSHFFSSYMTPLHPELIKPQVRTSKVDP